MGTLKDHFKFLKEEVKKWPEWKQKALRVRMENSRKRYRYEQ